MRIMPLERKKGADFSRLRPSKPVMQTTGSISPLKFDCPVCGSTWQEEIFFTAGTIVFKKPPCPKCGKNGKSDRSIAA